MRWSCLTMEDSSVILSLTILLLVSLDNETDRHQLERPILVPGCSARDSPDPKGQDRSRVSAPRSHAEVPLSLAAGDAPFFRGPDLICFPELSLA